MQDHNGYTSLREHWPLVERVSRVRAPEDRVVELAFVNSGKARVFVIALLERCGSPEFADLGVCTQLSTHLANVEHARLRDGNSRLLIDMAGAARDYVQEQRRLSTVAPVGEDQEGPYPLLLYE